MNLFVVAGVLM